MWDLMTRAAEGLVLEAQLTNGRAGIDTRTVQTPGSGQGGLLHTPGSVIKASASCAWWGTGGCDNSSMHQQELSPDGLQRYWVVMTQWQPRLDFHLPEASTLVGKAKLTETHRVIWLCLRAFGSVSWNTQGFGAENPESVLLIISANP